jgi:hypothetical protein
LAQWKKYFPLLAIGPFGWIADVSNANRWMDGYDTAATEQGITHVRFFVHSMVMTDAKTKNSASMHGAQFRRSLFSPQRDIVGNLFRT